MQIKKKNMNKQFEYIRAFAIVAVITIHTFYSALLQFGNTATIVENIFYRIVMNLMWWAVPCFLMMTGSLLLNPNREISIKKLYKKYISRMLVVLFTFGFIFSWVECFFNSRTITIMQIPHALLNVFTGDTWAHMWYIYCLIGLYVLLPIYKIIANYASDVQVRYILFVLFLFEAVFKLTKIVGIDLGFYCHINTIYPFWLLMGVAWNRGMLRKNIKFNIILLIVSSSILIIATVVWTQLEIPLNVLFGYDSVIVIAQVFSIFSLLNMISTDIKFNKILLEIGDKSFGIYIVHMVFINMVYKFLKFNPFTKKFVLTGIMLVFINLVFSYVVTKIMKHLPVLKKII